MADVKILGKEERLGIILQTNWATPAAASATFWTMQHVNTGNLIPDNATTVDQFNVTSQHGVHSEVERVYVDATSGLKRIPFSGIADKTCMAPLLVTSHFVVTEASTPYNKAITCGGLTAPIDFTNNGAKLFTWAIDQGGTATQSSPASTSDDGIILENAIVDQLTITWDFNNQGIARLVSYSGVAVGNEMNFEQSLSGTWENATPAQGFFNNTDAWAFITLTVDEVDVKTECIRRVEYSVNNNVTSSCAGTLGKPTQYDIAPEYTMKVVMNYNAVTEKFLKDFNDKGTVDANWSNDSAAAKTDGKWTIDMPTGYLISPPKIYEGDFLGVELNIKAYSTAGATPVTINYCDTKDWSID